MPSKPKLPGRFGRRDADNLLYIFTGKKAKQIFSLDNLIRGAARILPVVTDLVRDRKPPEEIIDPSDPYYILGVRKDAPMWVVRAAFRALSKEYHSDTGTAVDNDKFHAVQEAYRFIQQERKEQQGGR